MRGPCPGIDIGCGKTPSAAMHEALAGPWIGHADTCRNPRSCQRGGSGPDRLDRWGAGPFPLQPRGSRTRMAPMPQSNRRERGSASAKNGRSPWIWLKIRPFQPSSPGAFRAPARSRRGHPYGIPYMPIPRSSSRADQPQMPKESVPPVLKRGRVVENAQVLVTRVAVLHVEPVADDSRKDDPQSLDPVGCLDQDAADRKPLPGPEFGKRTTDRPVPLAEDVSSGRSVNRFDRTDGTPFVARAECARRDKVLSQRLLGKCARVRRWDNHDDVAQNAAMRLYRGLGETVPAPPRGLMGLMAVQIQRELFDLARKHAGMQGVERE